MATTTLEPPAISESPAAPSRRGRIPARVWVVALVAALLHMAPFWHAQLSTREGWTFTGNLTISPDYMQYRVWERQSQREGPIVTNTFTTEPNAKHLPVFFYWGVGKVGRWLGVRPEFVYAYAGAGLAIVLTLMVFAAVRRFLPDPTHAWWTFLAIMGGGGLGAYLKFASAVPVLNEIGLVRRFIIDPVATAPTFEEYRSHYVFRTLYDTHFLIIWIVMLGAVLALHSAFVRFTPKRAAAVALLFAAMTILHVYEGIVLVAIAAGISACVWSHRDERLTSLHLVTVGGVSVALSYAALGWLYRRSGLPLPEWNALNILFATLLISFPLTWPLVAMGLRRYWLNAGTNERFLLGWALGCTVVTLSGPFFPYPDRGTMTMQVPLLIITAAIYFARWRILTRRAALIALLALGASPAWQIIRSWYFTSFRTDAPFMYLNADHRSALGVLLPQSDTTQVLLAEPRDLLWLAPEFPGRFYVGHFFLTVNFREKNESLQRALATPDSLPALLARSGATWLYVNADRDPTRVASAASLSPVHSGPMGTLFRVGGGANGR
jgi:hypothetical protein